MTTRNDLRRLEEQHRSISGIGESIVQIDHQKFTITFDTPSGQHILYKPTPTGTAFHSDRDNLVRFVMGPYGSGKSSICCSELVFRASSMPKCDDGIRRYSAAVIRNTFPQLKTTTIKSWKEWFGQLGQVHSVMTSPITWNHVFYDQQGRIEMEILFLALDKEDDIKNLDSLQVTDAYVNELRHVPQAVFKNTIDRTGRFPPETLCKEKIKGRIITDSNPPKIRSWIYDLFEVKKPESHKIFRQPPAVFKENGKYVVNPKAENLEHLSEGAYYYEKMMYGASDEHIKVYCMGDYGISSEGKVIFPEYNDNLHSVEHVELLKDEPLRIYLDYGVTPVALILQFSKTGQMRILYEQISRSYGLKSFFENQLIPFLCQDEFSGLDWIFKGDPSGESKSLQYGISCHDIVREMGYEIECAKTNEIKPRLEAGRFFLTRLVGENPAQPALIVDKNNCTTVREAFLQEYRFKEVGSVDAKEIVVKPNKTHPWSDVMDCYEYGCLDYGDFVSEKTPLDVSQFINRERF